eukprot:TRINITY_DN313_c1_g1_i8.p2 TRINITY_DN313_c1_g1~~TRINITY_DN313_c1_g1_i8.p2  ORF type:complete len:229 (+),score=-24.00 TRINITY_DN313_c1_g1_i8:199-885(+)
MVFLSNLLRSWYLSIQTQIECQYCRRYLAQIQLGLLLVLHFIDMQNMLQQRNIRINIYILIRDFVQIWLKPFVFLSIVSICTKFVLVCQYLTRTQPIKVNANVLVCETQFTNFVVGHLFVTETNFRIFYIYYCFLCSFLLLHVSVYFCEQQNMTVLICFRISQKIILRSYLVINYFNIEYKHLFISYYKVTFFTLQLYRGGFKGGNWRENFPPYPKCRTIFIHIFYSK